jgi:hypothetical protein
VSAAGGFLAAFGTLVGAYAGQFLAAAIAALLVSAFYPNGDLGALGILVFAFVLGAWPGGVVGLWVVLRFLHHPRIRRAVVILALLIPLLAPVLGTLLPAAGVVLHPLMIAPLVALLGAAAYLFTAAE